MLYPWIYRALYCCQSAMLCWQTFCNLNPENTWIIKQLSCLDLDTALRGPYYRNGDINKNGLCISRQKAPVDT